MPRVHERGKIFWAYRPQFSSWTWIAILIGVIVLLTVSPSRPAALATPPITSSVLNTQISEPTTLPSVRLRIMTHRAGGTQLSFHMLRTWHAWALSRPDTPR